MADVAANSGTEDSMGLANGANKGIWGSIFLEVDKVNLQLPLLPDMTALSTPNQL